MLLLLLINIVNWHLKTGFVIKILRKYIAKIALNISRVIIKIRLAKLLALIEFEVGRV